MLSREPIRWWLIGKHLERKSRECLLSEHFDDDDDDIFDRAEKYVS